MITDPVCDPKLAQLITNCQKCKLNTHRSLPYGTNDAKVIFIGINPGYEIGRTGVDPMPFQFDRGPRSGSSIILAQLIKDLGLDLKDIYVTNLVKCACEDHEPTASIVNNCKGFITSELSSKPTAKHVICLGKIVGKQFGINTFWGTTMRQGKEMVLAWHPNYVLRKQTLYGEYLYRMEEFLRR